MKNRVYLLISVFFMAGGTMYAQGEMDVYRLSQTDLNGTARYLGMSGAFGALGGDISAIYTNPGGLAIYRSSEVVTTFSVKSGKAQSDWNGSKANASNTKLGFDNIAYVGHFRTKRDEGILAWNIGLSYNRLKDFNRSYKLSGSHSFSVADYMAGLAYGMSEPSGSFISSFSDDPALAALGFYAGFIESYKGKKGEYHSSFGREVDGEWESYSPQSTDLQVQERGYLGRYNLSLATNISNRFFLGMTFSLIDLQYSVLTRHSEHFSGSDYAWLDNEHSIDGAGCAVNLGAIFYLVDFLRLGIAYNSPIWNWYIDDYNDASAQTSIKGTRGTHNFQAYDNRLRTSDRWIFSLAGIGRNFLLSIDYELADYNRMRLSDSDGYDLQVTDDIDNDFGISGTLKVGAELKLASRFSVRAGALWRTSPVKQHIKDGIPVRKAGSAYYADAIRVVGMIPNYTVDKGSKSYSFGLGYRFTPKFYADIAYVYSEHKEVAYVFPGTFIQSSGFIPFIKSDPASLKTKTTQVALTLGYKF